MRDNSGILSRNEFKEEGKNQPDLRGSALINGIPYKISSWHHKDKNGKPYFSLAFQPVLESEAEAARNPKPQAPIGDDSIPF